MNEFQQAKHESSTCPSCGGESVRQKTITDEFDYGLKDSSVTLYAQVIVYTCDDCDFAFTDDSAARSRHESVCQHLGRLTPSEIRSLRSRLGLSQNGLSEVTGFSEASIVRWETGSLIQSESSNRFLLLLEQPSVLPYLASITSDDDQRYSGHGEVGAGQSQRFRAIDPRQFELRKQTFRLRLVG